MRLKTYYFPELKVIYSLKFYMLENKIVVINELSVKVKTLKEKMQLIKEKENNDIIKISIDIERKINCAYVSINKPKLLV